MRDKFELIYRVYDLVSEQRVCFQSRLVTLSNKKTNKVNKRLSKQTSISHRPISTGRAFVVADYRTSRADDAHDCRHASSRMNKSPRFADLCLNRWRLNGNAVSSDTHVCRTFSVKTFVNKARIFSLKMIYSLCIVTIDRIVYFRIYCIHPVAAFWNICSFPMHWNGSPVKRALPAGWQWMFASAPSGPLGCV